MKLQRFITDKPPHGPAGMVKSNPEVDPPTATCDVCLTTVPLTPEQLQFGQGKCFGNTVIISWTAHKLN